MNVTWDVTIRITNRCDFLFYVFISFFSSFSYMFRAFMGPSSEVLQACNTPDDGPMKARNM